MLYSAIILDGVGTRASTTVLPRAAINSQLSIPSSHANVFSTKQVSQSKCLSRVLYESLNREQTELCNALWCRHCDADVHNRQFLLAM